MRLSPHVMKPKDDGSELLVTGLGVGVIGVAGAVVLGATCPVCVVATPALLGAGLYKKWRSRTALSKEPGSVQAPERARTGPSGSKQEA